MILFRADGNSSVGLGHVMRCLSIADAFKNAGESCLFVTADNELHQTIKERGHKNLALGTKYDHMESELSSFVEEIEKRDIQIIFVDSYFVTEKYLRTLWQFCAKKYIILVYIDDVFAFPYPCDILLNYNIYADEGTYQKLYAGYATPNFLLNTSYEPIRAEFQNLLSREPKQEARDILISTGGSDCEHMGLEIVKAINAHTEWNDYRFHLIVGMMNEDKDEMGNLAEGKENIVLHKEVKAMSELMQSCDVAISAAGSTLYELCATQTPTITYILADNQIPGAEGFQKSDVLKCAGDIRNLGAEELAEKLLLEAVALAGNYEKRVNIASRMKTIIDGKGAERIAQKVNEIWNQYAIAQRPEDLKRYSAHPKF